LKKKFIQRQQKQVEEEEKEDKNSNSNSNNNSNINSNNNNGDDDDDNNSIVDNYPGYVSNLFDWLPEDQLDSYRDSFPSSRIYHLFDPDILSNLFTKFGFEIEKVDYVRYDGCLEEYDEINKGRTGTVGIIARKPIDQ